jgi:hypothetical protein
MGGLSGAVGEDEVGLERRLGDATADEREVADGVAQAHTVAPEGVGDGDGADVGSRDRAHRSAPIARWY